MKCEKCGNELTGKANFCRICGTPVKKDEVKKSITIEKNNIRNANKSNNLADKKIQLTGNIDVTKIKIGNTTSDNIEDVSGDEIKITKESADKEFKAMLEITSIENQPKKSLDINDELDVSLVNDNNILDKINCTDKIKTEDSEMKINVMPGEANSLEVQSTSELEALLSDNSQDKKIVKNEVSEEVSLELNKSSETELNESTMFVPDELIINKNDENEINNSDCKTKELDEVTTPILPVTSKLEKIKDDLTEIDLSKSEESLNNKEDIVEKTEEVSDNTINSLSNLKSEKEEYSTTDSNNITHELDAILSNDNNDNNENQTFSQPIRVKKERRIGVLILVLLLIACMLSLGYLGYNLLISNEEINDLRTKNKALNDKITEVQNTDSNQQLSNDNKSSLKMNGYDIVLDDTNEYAIEGDSLLIKSSQNDIVIRFGLNVDYTTIKEDKDSYRELLIENDYDAKSYGTKVVDNREYVVYEVETKEGNEKLVAYTNLSDKNTICFLISYNDNEVNYDFLSNINKFIDSLKIDYSYDNINYDFFIKEENAS